MKKIIYMALAFAAASTLFSCHEELTIPDPGFDMTQSRIDTVRRDTTDTYKLSLNVKAPNGVDYIQLINGRNFQVIKDYPEHVGKKDFHFETEISLKDCDPERDSIFIYNLKIHTKDNRSFNKSIRIQHLKLSHPTMLGPSGNTMPVYGRAFVFDGVIDAGYYNVTSLKVYLNNDEVYTAPADQLGNNQIQLYHKLTRDYVAGNTYKYKVVVTDSNNQQGEWIYNIVSAKLKKPVAIAVCNPSGTAIRECCMVYYDDRGRVEKMRIPTYSGSYVYN
ncbi:MAG: hypothetical protein HUJ93_07865, partial [Bacteroidales bacterium]|nr:hypothetical protein [Bacteroidales bacterium]